MRARSARFDRVISSSAPKLATRVDVLFNGAVIIGGEDGVGLNVESGDITYDRTAAIMARGRLGIAEPTRIPTIDAGGPLSPYGYELQVWRGLTYSDGTSELLSLGVFPIQHSSFDGATLFADIELLDRSKLVIDAKFQTDYTVASGVNLATALQALIADGVPGLTYAFQSTTFTTSAVVFRAASDRWAAARALAKAAGCEVFFNGLGECVLRAEPGSATEPVLTISEGEGGTLNAIRLDLDREPTYNRVVVTGSNSSNGAVYRAIATDDDPSSPTYYDGPFGRRVFFYTSEHINSSAQAGVVAGALLAAYSGVARTLSLSAVPNPALEPGDVVQTTHAGLNVNDLYIVDGFSIGLKADSLLGISNADVWRGSMTISARFVQSVAQDIPTDPEDPDDPAFTGLTNEGFDDTFNEVAPSIITTSAASVTGSGSLTHSQDVAFGPGGVSLKLDGTAQHFLTFGADYTAHAEHLGSLYGHVARWPSANAWCVGLRDDTDSATVAQLGINSSGQFIIRTGDSGAVDDTSVVSSIDTGFLFEFRTVGGSMSVSIYDAVSEVLVDTISCPVSASAFTNDQLGLLETISGTSAAIGNLQNDDFTGTNGSAIATANRSLADAVSGSGTLTFSTTNAISGVGVRVNGLSYHMMRYDNASHTDHYVYLPWYHVTTPSANAYIWEVRAGNGTTIGAQFGVTSTAKFRIRDANTGTTGAGSADEYSGTLTSQQYYTHHLLLGAAGYTCLIYDSGGSLVDTLTCTLTATNFSDERIGLISTTTGTALVGTIDNFKSDNAAVPSGTVATGPLIYWDRFITDTTTMPDRLDLGSEPPPPTYDAKLRPEYGAWQGVTAAPTDSEGHTTLGGYNEWMGLDADMVRPHILGWYHTNAWNGVLTNEQKGLLIRAGEPPAIAHLRWKVRTTMTWAQIANGNANADIDRVANGLSQWPHPIFLTVSHEPDNNTPFTTGNQPTDFANMWRHVYTRVKAQMTTAAFARIAWVVNWAGYSSMAGTGGANYEDFYPGDEYVDWIAYNPYPHNFSRNTLDELVNENITGTSGWPGQYNYWLEVAPTKPQMLAEWGIDHDPGTGMTDTQAATVLDTIALDLTDFPQLQAYEYWNAQTGNGDYQPQTANAAMRTAMKDLVNNAWFDQDTTDL